jgi:MFS family permease
MNQNQATTKESSDIKEEESSFSFPYLKTALISLGYFTSNLTWVVYNVKVSLFLDSNLSPYLSDANVLTTVVGLIMVLDNIAALLIQPYIGELSDRTWIPKLGRRMPFIIIGIPLAAFFFGLIGTFRGTLVVLLIAITGFNVSMAFYKSPVMSLIPDSLPNEYRSQGSGVLNIVGGVAGVAGLFIVNALQDIGQIYPFWDKFSFWAVSIIMIFCLIILVLTVREKKDIEVEHDDQIGVFKSMKKVFKEPDRALKYMLVAVFLEIAAYTTVETFVSIYMRNILGIPEIQAGYILAVFIGFQIVGALPVGLVAKRIGAVNACLVGLIGLTASLVPLVIISLTDVTIIRDILTFNNLVFSWEVIGYFFLILLLGFSLLLLAINVLVVVWDMAPQHKNATYTSYFYLAMHSGAIISPFLAGACFDLYQFLSGRDRLQIFFVYILAFYGLSLLFVILTKSTIVKRIKQDVDDEAEFAKKQVEKKQYPLQFLPMLLFGFGIQHDSNMHQLAEKHKNERKEIKEKYKEIIRKQKKEKKGYQGDKQELKQKHNAELEKIRKEERKLRERQRKERRKLRKVLIDEKITEKITEQEKKKDNFVSEQPEKDD